MKLFVVGFAFLRQQSRVVLIRKNRPAWQADKLNGVGGHVEDAEPRENAMEREFREETGVTIPSGRWRFFGEMHGQGWLCYCAAVDLTVEEYALVGTMTDERIETHDALALPEEVLPNLRWLIPMALSPEHNTYARVAYRGP